MSIFPLWQVEERNHDTWGLLILLIFLKYQEKGSKTDTFRTGSNSNKLYLYWNRSMKVLSLFPLSLLPLKEKKFLLFKEWKKEKKLKPNSSITSNCPTTLSLSMYYFFSFFLCNIFYFFFHSLSHFDQFVTWVTSEKSRLYFSFPSTFFLLSFSFSFFFSLFSLCLLCHFLPGFLSSSRFLTYK